MGKNKFALKCISSPESAAWLLGRPLLFDMITYIMLEESPISDVSASVVYEHLVPLDAVIISLPLCSDHLLVLLLCTSTMSPILRDISPGQMSTRTFVLPGQLRTRTIGTRLLSEHLFEPLSKVSCMIRLKLVSIHIWFSNSFLPI